MTLTIVSACKKTAARPKPLVGTKSQADLGKPQNAAAKAGAIWEPVEFSKLQDPPRHRVNILNLDKLVAVGECWTSRRFLCTVTVKDFVLRTLSIIFLSEEV